MVYMFGGKPLHTANHPEMPQEYYPYVYYLWGMHKNNQRLSKPVDELEMKGEEALKWIMENE